MLAVLLFIFYNYHILDKKKKHYLHFKENNDQLFDFDIHIDFDKIKELFEFYVFQY